MKRRALMFCALFLLILPTSFVFAQAFTKVQAIPENPDDDDRFSVNYRFNEPGDQYIKLSLMITFPLNFDGDFPLYRSGQLSTGGAGNLGYHRFITSTFIVGFDVNFGYNPTIGENMFTYVPFMLTFTYQPTFKRLEFPVTLGIGCAFESYLNRTYFPGLVLKPQIGIYYRVTASWSFGINGEYMYMPQWYSDSENDDYGLFASIAIAARYHF